MKHQETTTPAESVTEEVSAPPRCAWSYETYDPLEGEAPTPPVECTTGKPALYFNCNEWGPVCEDHTCRCRPQLIAEREAARRKAHDDAERKKRQDQNRRDVCMAAFTYRWFHKMWVRGDKRFPKQRVDAARDALFAAIDNSELPAREPEESERAP